MKKAFTLIELLVVVLIIGILAAIALPQYEKAVERSRSIEGLVKLRALQDAIERYYWENNTYPYSTADLEKLDISVADNSLWKASYSSNYLSLSRRQGGNTLYRLSYVPKYGGSSAAGRKSCDIMKATDDNSIGSKTCKALCGVSTLQTIWGGGWVGCVLP